MRRALHCLGGLIVGVCIALAFDLDYRRPWVNGQILTVGYTSGPYHQWDVLGLSIQAYYEARYVYVYDGTPKLRKIHVDTATYRFCHDRYAKAAPLMFSGRATWYTGVWDIQVR